MDLQHRYGSRWHVHIDEFHPACSIAVHCYYPDLRLNKIYTVTRRLWMFNLQTCVHFEEIEIPVLVNKKLDGSCTEQFNDRQRQWLAQPLLHAIRVIKGEGSLLQPSGADVVPNISFQRGESHYRDCRQVSETRYGGFLKILPYRRSHC